MTEILERFVAHAHSERIAIRDEAGTHGYAELVRGAFGVSASLLGEHGGASLEGARVALFVQPGMEFVAAFFGVLLAGGCVVVLSPLHPLPETRYFCEDAHVRVVLVSAAFRAQAAPVGGTFGVRDVAPLLVGSAAPAPEPSSLTEASPALQLYTSGTTGKPKGAVLTHGNIGVQQRLVGEAWGFGPGDVLLHSLPLHHMHGLAIALLTAIGAGATVRMRGFDAPAIWDEMADATVFMGVPAMYHRLMLAFDAADAERRSRWTANARGLRLATSGSAALPVTLAERWKAITGTIPLERFGMTEIGVGITNSLAGPRFAGSVGLPLPTVETRIVGDDGDAEVGELWIRGPSVFPGYHERPDETKAAFVPSEGGAWFRTGDTVTRDPALPGHPFRILGRTSVDILKSGGYKLSALEIEEVLREHGGVAEAAVIGLADEAWGDRVVACIVKRPEVACEANDLRAFVRERLAAYKVPKDVVFLDELPKNALGKVVKPELARQIQRAQPSG
jgi:malonyl-CoA/methylmalonyl-CoA synthetase